MGRKGRVERRKDIRYKAIEGAYAAMGPNSQKLGQIVDISRGGLCFKYIDASNDDKDFGTQQEDLIFLSSMGHYVGDLPFKTVGDYLVTNAPSFSFMKIRKRHGQFFDLSVKQLFDLDCYLRDNVSEPVQ
ncbi:MAG: PilZ domain-containing protein [Proteobacteria bacterium]|nr:PilZ domain-containing protein [Pseudomonadota bacterium]MBU1582125.1 PilZ domain-containing protein [Pseudomonadota bacterium]MBU2631152.1 PilZ domain-containing protein [Pseudomonadota bacterium]